MKNKLIVAITIALFALSINQTSAYPSYSAKASDFAKASSDRTTDRQGHTKKINNSPKTKKPTYYRGYSDGLQNYPGKTIDAGMNTGMLPTNSASHSGNDVSF